MDGDSATEDLEQPSTSKKKDTRKTRSSENTKDDQRTNSKTSMSHQSSFSDRSRSSAHSGLNMPKAFSKKRTDNGEDCNMHGKDETTDPNKEYEGRKNRCLSGRIGKRKQKGKRQRTRRAPKRKIRVRRERNKRDISLSTILTRLSSSLTPGCQYCGHRCCRRRYEYMRERNRQRYARNNRRNNAKNSSKSKNTKVLISGAVANQMGSRCKMLSPLFIKSSSGPSEQVSSNVMCREISPEMIIQALKTLTMWRQEVGADVILEYIKANYPVNPDEGILTMDLEEKLRVAAIVGIVTRWGNNCWALPTALQKRALTKTQVTVFWQAYADTMSPFGRREKVSQPLRDKKDISTEMN